MSTGASRRAPPSCSPSWRTASCVASATSSRGDTAPVSGIAIIFSLKHLLILAPGYFSYKWAEVLSADAFGAFEEAGLDDAAAVAATGRRFADTVLACGGARAPADVFADFRGRPPSTAALLRHSGLA